MYNLQGIDYMREIGSPHDHTKNQTTPSFGPVK